MSTATDARAHLSVPQTGGRVIEAWEATCPADEYRVLLTQAWPIGHFMRRFAIDEWPRELLPSRHLRRWFANNPSRSDEFRDRYLAEIAGVPHRLSALCARAAERPIAVVVDGSPIDRHCGELLLRLIASMRGRARRAGDPGRGRA